MATEFHFLTFSAGGVPGDFFNAKMCLSSKMAGKHCLIEAIQH